ncbi:MAG: peptide chain release factor aRF-1, partial [Thermodesulfobacteriota bacterium]
RIADYARTYFLDNTQVKEIYILSPAFTKHDFMAGEYLEYRLQKKVTRLIDGCYAGEEGLYELFNRVNNNE